MAATKRQFNWGTVTYASTTITGIQSIDVDPQAQLAKFSGDGDLGPTTIVGEFIDNLITVVAGDILAIRTIAPFTRGAFSAVHKDAKGAAGGALTYTVASGQGIVANNPTSGGHKAFGSGRLIIAAEWADSTTNPVSSAAA